MRANLPTKLTENLAEQKWLDGPAKAVQNAVSRVYEAAGPAGRHVKNFLHGLWLGHPLHPVLTDVPLGAWSAAMMLDSLETTTGKRSFGVGADAAVAMGVAGALSAAVAGLTDWYQLSGKPRRIGWAHALLNVTATGLYGASMVARRRRRRSAGRGLALAGFMVSMGGAYLGGHLVFAHRIGVRHSRDVRKPEQFVPVLPVAELGEGKLRRVEVEGTRVLVVRRGERIFALAENCSHQDGPLSEGWLVENSVVCPWHQSRYSLEDGHVLDGPSTYDQPCYETRVRNGQVELRARRPEQKQPAQDAQAARPPEPTRTTPQASPSGVQGQR